MNGQDFIVSIILIDADNDIIDLVRTISKNNKNFSIKVDTCNKIQTPPDKLDSDSYDIFIINTGKEYSPLSEYRRLIKKPDNASVILVYSEDYDEKYSKDIEQYENAVYLTKQFLTFSFLKKIIDDEWRNKSTELALQDISLKIKQRFDSLPVPAFLWKWTGKELKLADCNRAATEFSKGYSKKMLGKSALQIFTNNQPIVEQMHKCLNLKKTLVQELNFEFKNGSKYKDILTTLLFEEPDLLFTYLVDLAEHREIKRRLKTTEDRYQNLLEHIPIGIYRTTPDGRIIDANTSLAELLGYDSIEELYYLNVNNLYVTKTIRNAHLSKLKKTPITIADYELRQKNGNIIQVRDYPRAIKDTGGKIIYYDGALVDITETKKAQSELEKHQSMLERKIEVRTEELTKANRQLKLEIDERIRVEKELRRNEERFKGITDRSFDAIFEVDTKGYVTYVSPAIEKILGYKPEEIIGNMFASVLPDHKNPKIKQGLKLINRGRNLRSLEMVLRRKDGSIAYVEFNAAPIIYERKVIGGQGNIRDITDRKKVEDTLIRQINEMTVLHEVSVACAGADNSDRLIERVTEIIGKALYPTNFGILLYNEKQELLITHPSYRLWKGQEAVILKLGEGLCGTAAVQDRPIRVADVRLDSHYVESDISTCSELCVPMKIGERIIGVINTESDKVNAFTEDDERLLLTFAGLLVTALDRLRVESSLIRQVKELTVLYSVGTACVEATNAESLLKRVTDIIGENLFPANFDIMLIDPKTNLLHTRRSFHYREGPEKVIIKLGEGVTGTVAVQGKPMLIPDVRKVPFYIEENPNTRSELCVPLKIGNRVIGVINVEHEDLDVFSEDDERILMTFAGQLATALDRLRVESSLVRQVKELTVLYNVGSACVEATNAEDLLERVTKIIGETIYPTNFGILLLDQKNGLLKTHSSYRYHAGQESIALKLGEGVTGTVATTGVSMRVPDVRKEPLYYEGDPSTGSELCVPLKIGSRVIGVINVEHERPDAFTDDDERVLMTLAGQLAIALDRLRVESSLVRQVKELTVLHSVGTACVEETNAKDLLERVTNIIGENLFPSNFGIFLLDQKSGLLRTLAYYRSRKGPAPYTLKLGEGITGTVASKGKPMLVPDVSKEPLYIAEDPDTRSELCAPIKIGDRVLGVINVEHGRIDAFTPDDERILMTFAGQLAMALDRLRVETSLVHQVKELNVLFSVGTACVEETKTEVLLERVTKIIGENIFPTNFGIMLLDLKKGLLRTHASYRYGKGQESIVLKVGEGIAGTVAATGKPMLVPDVRKEPLYYEGDPSTRSEVSVPIKIGKRILGVINVEHERTDAFSEDDERILITLADQLSLGLERIKTEQSLVRQVKELTVLHSVSVACAEANDEDDLIERVTGIIGKTIYSTNFGIMLLNKETGILRTHPSYRLWKGQKAITIKLNQGLTGTAAASGKPIRIGDVEKEPMYFKGDEKTKSELCVPIIVGKEVLGVINTEHDTPDAFTEDDERLLLTFAGQIGLGLERIRTSRELKKEKDKFQNYIDIAGVILLALDSDYRITLINKRGSDLLGYASEELVGRNWLNHCIPERYQEAETILYRMIFNGEIINVEESEGYVLTRDGKERIILWHRSILKDEHGNVTGVLSSGEDITMRLELEKKLRKSEEEYRTLVENINVGVYRSTPDIEGYFLKANPSIAKILGYKQNEDMTKVPLLYHYKDHEARKSFIEEITNCKSMKNKELPIVKKDGSIIWGSFTATAEYDENNNIKWIDGILEDITEQKLAEDALVAEKERLSVTLSSIGDGVITVNINGKIVLLNKVAFQLMGVKEKEAVGKDLYTILHLKDPATGDRYDEILDIVLSQGSIVEVSRNLALSSRSKENRIVSVSGAPLRDKKSAIIGAVIVIRDITEKLKLEEELLKAQKLESVGVLAGGIAHDFNNILAAVLGNLSLAVMHTDSSSKASRFLAEAEKAITRAANLTNQLLTFSKGGLPIKKIVSIKDFLTETINFTLTGSNVEAEYYLQKNLWNAKIDRDQISQVISNIVINAIQAMPRGGLIEVTAKNLFLYGEDLPPLKEGDYIRINVKDNGMGIREEHLVKIFDPYFTTKKNGTGLGLATSYSIIKKHEGTITVDSKPGAGATFSIYLPAYKGPTVKDELPSQKIEKGTGRILYMDDEEIICRTVEDLLRILGYSVTTANDGNQAMKIFEEANKKGQPFDLVILDLTIPGGIGGKEVVKKLLEKNPEIKAIATSGYSNDPIMSAFKDYGFSGILAKPFKIQTLSDELKKVLSKGRH